MPISDGNRSLSTKMRGLVMGLLILSTALYTVGITLERGGEKPATPAVQQQPGEGQAGHSETGEASGGAVTGSLPETGRQETVLGINLESPGFIIAAILAAVLLLVLLWLFQRLALWLVIVFAVSAALLDVLEVITQLNRANQGLALLALLVLIAHAGLGIAAGAGVMQTRAVRQPPQPMGSAD